MYFDGVIYFIPLVNCDGVKLVLDGEGGFKTKTKSFLSTTNKANNYQLFKSNINGVDLNTNFDANWGSGKYNIVTPNYQNYIGPYPHSEPETKALVDFTQKIKPDMTISYHLKGEVIYYGFLGQDKQTLLRDYNIAKALSNLTGYQPILTKNSSGGYKDYCTTYLNIPAFTIEVGSDKLSHPLPLTSLKDIINKNLEVPLVALKQLEKL